MYTVTSANVANAIVKLVAVDALPMLLGGLTMGNLVTRSFEPVCAVRGDVIAEGDAQVVLSTAAECTFQVPDVTKVLAIPDLLKLYMYPAVTALAEMIDGDLLRLCDVFPVISGDMSKQMLDAADQALFEARGAPSADKVAVVTPTAFTALRQLPQFSEYSNPYDAGLRFPVDGPVGRIGCFYVVRSQFQPHQHGVAFTKRAISLVTRRQQFLAGQIAEYAEIGNFGMRVTMDYQPNTLTQQFTLHVLYGCAVVNRTHGVQLRPAEATR
jgi:hypothetical protein